MGNRLARRCATAVIALALVGSLLPANERTAREIGELVSKMKAGDTGGWAKIPWVGSLVDARRHSQQENAPTFLFLLDGNISSGRC
jgi:hypothetical protein